MPDIGPKRIAEFIEPFRVEPGRRVRLPRDFDPAGSRQVSTKEAKADPAPGRRAARRVPDAPRRAGHVRRRHGPPGDGRRRQGRHDPPRHERRQPAGRPGQQLQGPVHRGPRPRLPVALREEAARARQHRHLQSLLLRGGPRRPRPPADPGQPEDPGQAQGPRHLEAPLPRDQRLGALPDRPGLPLRQALPQRVARRSSAAGSWPASTRPTGTGSSARATPRSAPYWDDYQKAFSDVLPTRARLGALVRRPGRRQAVRPGRGGRRPRPHAHRDRPAFPKIPPRRPRGPPVGQGRARGPGASRAPRRDPIEVELAEKARRRSRRKGKKS